MAQTLEELKEMGKSRLVNMLYNTWIYSHADGDKDSDEKAIPYMGWFWRSSDFVSKSVAIGKHDGYVGVMENNKWGYAERLMTDEEVDKFIEFLDRTIVESRKGGMMSKLIETRDVVLTELREWMYGLGDIGNWSEPYEW